MISKKLLSVKPRTAHTLDLLALGEVMIRLDPGDSRIRNTRSFHVWEGGGEYNVARSLRKAYGMTTAIATALVDNEIGRLAEDLIMQGGVDTSYIVWREDSGFIRNGLNFTERGFGLRGPLGVSDRSFTAVADLGATSIAWEQIFKERSIRWMHTGGVFAGLSPTTHECALEALKVAQSHQTVISYDLNYRPGLWKKWGDPARAQTINSRLVREVDALFGSREDFSVALGLSEPQRKNLSPQESFNHVVDATCGLFPNIKMIAMTHRTIHSASTHSWQGFLWSDDQTAASRVYDHLQVFDRVGSGDSFVAGVIHGLLSGQPPQVAVDQGAAHGALAMTTAGDSSAVSHNEIMRLVQGEVPRILR